MYAHMHSIQPMLQLHTVSACTVAHVYVRAHGIYQGAYKYAYVYIYMHKLAYFKYSNKYLLSITITVLKNKLSINKGILMNLFLINCNVNKSNYTA